MVSRRLGLLSAMTVALLVSTAALAGEWGIDGASRDGWNRHHHHNPPPSYGGGYGLPTIVPGLGTFAGTISALRVRGVGTYFYVEGFGGTKRDMIPAPKAKIISVETERDPCSYESGVCVIRP